MTAAPPSPQHRATTTRETKTRTTPVRLRLWTATLVSLVAALLAALTVTIADTQRGVHRVSRETAPQAQATSDLYFALSDLDTQNARSLLAIGDDDLNGDLLDSVQTAHQRITDIDTDLRSGIGGTADPAAQTAFQSLLDDVARYASMSGQAIALDEQSPDTRPGKPIQSALSFYSQATDLMHARMLPAAARLRDTFGSRLTSSANAQHDAAVRDVVTSGALGLATLAALVRFQGILRKRFSRAVNPALALATAITLVLLGSAIAVNIQQTSNLHAAVADHMDPYLAIQQARALTFDATGDAIRYVVAPPFGYQRGLDENAAKLVAPDGRGLLADGLTHTDATLAATIKTNWPAVLKDARSAMAAVDAGDVAEALDFATGIARGRTAFDFYVLDVHLGQAAETQRAAFESDSAAVRSGTSGWAEAPAAALGIVTVLILAAVRPRLAEYR